MLIEYPPYQVDISPEKVAECRRIAQRLLAEVGLKVDHDKFVSSVAKHSAVRASGGRVYLDHELTDRYFDDYIDRKRKELARDALSDDRPWSLSCGGFSIAVIDLGTDKARPATCQDLRDLIRLCHSFDIGGNYPCTPQDLPPLMRALACFKICWQESDRIRPFDYLDFRQTPYLFEMHRLMGKPFVVNVNIPEPFTVSEQDIETALYWYPQWKRDPDSIAWYSICDYPMLGVTKPITSSGSVTSYLAQSFGAHILFRLYDPEWRMTPRLSAGMPVDLQNMCWAFGSPRQHLYDLMNFCVLPALCGFTPGTYHPSGFMATSSCAVDARAGMEKMATTLVSALQGARSFAGAGNLAVDDLFSAIQLALDVEIFQYVRELIDAFRPHPDIVSTDNLYEIIADVALGNTEFYSHADTAAKVRKLLPVSKRRPSEKLRNWMLHETNIKDRLRDECLERIRNQKPFALADEKRRELDNIYNRAQAKLAP